MNKQIYSVRSDRYTATPRALTSAVSEIVSKNIDWIEATNKFPVFPAALKKMFATEAAVAIWSGGAYTGPLDSAKSKTLNAGIRSWMKIGLSLRAETVVEKDQSLKDGLRPLFKEVETTTNDHDNTIQKANVMPKIKTVARALPDILGDYVSATMEALRENIAPQSIKITLHAGPINWPGDLKSTANLPAEHTLVQFPESPQPCLVENDQVDDNYGNPSIKKNSGITRLWTLPEGCMVYIKKDPQTPVYYTRPPSSHDSKTQYGMKIAYDMTF